MWVKTKDIWIKDRLWCNNASMQVHQSDNCILLKMLITGDWTEEYTLPSNFSVCLHLMCMYVHVSIHKEAMCVYNICYHWPKNVSKIEFLKRKEQTPCPMLECPGFSAGPWPSFAPRVCPSPMPTSDCFHYVMSLPLPAFDRANLHPLVHWCLGYSGSLHFNTNLRI